MSERARGETKKKRKEEKGTVYMKLGKFGQRKKRKLERKKKECKMLERREEKS